MKKKFNYAPEAFQNPYIGFTSFQHFRNDPLYSDLVVRPENNMTETEHVECYPVPDYVEENGREQGYYPDSSVVYIRILWKEFEPEHGVFNFDFTDSIFARARAEGQTVMFRLMQHSTRETDDVPDWVKSLVECPARPIGKRVKTSPSDPFFLKLFADAIKVFGNRYDNDPTLAFIDISLPGAWGEGSDCRMFTNDQLRELTDAYIEAFPNTEKIGQLALPWLVDHMNEIGHAGWRADCIGSAFAHNKSVPEKEAQMSEVWKRGHVSFESYWWLGEWQRQGWDLDMIIADTLKWHVSTFNAKSLPIPNEWRDKIDRWVSKMGYHYTIREVELPDILISDEELTLRLEIDNVGVAPIYHFLPLNIRLKSDSAEFTLTTDCDIRRWLPGTHTEELRIKLPSELKCGNCRIELGIGGGDYPEVCFASDAEADGSYAVLAEVSVD